MAERNKNNPLKISDRAIETTVSYLTGKPFDDLTTLKERIGRAPFKDILTDEFQLLRLGSMGWEVNVPLEIREKYGVRLSTIDSMGSEMLALAYENKETDTEGAMDFFIGVALLRAFIASTYVEQARIDHLPAPDINNKAIDALPLQKKAIETVYAKRKGLFVIDAEDLEEQWREENPRLQQETMRLKDKLVERFTPRTWKLYPELPENFIQDFTPTVRQQWDDCLNECALSAYAWFTPKGPPLIPVRIKGKHEGE